MGCADGQQVGFGERKGAQSVALLWTGTAANAVELRGPDPQQQTMARAVAAGIQVGYYHGRAREPGPGRPHAMLWRGGSETAVDLHPPKMWASEAAGLGDGEQVGVVWPKLAFDVVRPALWRGTAESFVDLTPKGLFGGSASTCAQGIQVGLAYLDKRQQISHAAVWGGMADDFVDLHAHVPERDFNRSQASGLLVEGTRLRIVGEVSLWKDDASWAQQAALWEAELRA